MNIANAIGFFLLGVIMQVVPQVASLGGSSASADAQTLWLQVMGLVTGLIGGSYLAREGSRELVATLSRAWARRLEVREQLARNATQRVPLGGVRVTF